MENGIIAIAAALALLPCAFAGLAMGLATGKAADATARQPEASGDIRNNMIIAAALIEGVALLSVVVCLLTFIM